MRLQITLFFIYYCLKIRTNPWAFFQIHAHFFDVEKWIFSKYDIEQAIPEQWRLGSYRVNNSDTTESILQHFELPLFWKPEWGQNAHGISYIESKNELKIFLKKSRWSDVGYVIQEACDYAKEYEICFSKDPDNLDTIVIHSLVEAENMDGVHISSIHAETRYKEVLHEIDMAQCETIAEHIESMWDLFVGRVGMRANSLQDIVDGNFKVFEINIFIPMPLKLLAYNVDQSQKDIFLHKWTQTLAGLTKQRPKHAYREVFLRKIWRHYKIKLLHNSVYMNLKKIIYSFIEKNFLGGCSDYNSLSVRKACRSKFQARNMFAKHDIPHAQWLVFFNPYSAYRFAKEHGFPLVLKPDVSGFSRGSHFPINNFKEFWIAMFFVKWWWPVSVIETYLLWKNYRVVVTKNSVDIVTQRYPAFVIWDGEKTISQLIDAENTIREEMKLTPVIHCIEKSTKIARHLKKQSLNFTSVPQKDQNIELFHRIALAPGWVVKTVELDSVTKKNKALFIKILDLFESNLFGIDVIMEEGMHVDYDKQKTIFLEVNSRPYLKMHEYPRFGEKPDMKQLYDKLDALEVDGRGVF